MFRPRPALLLLALGTAGALPVVELQKDIYEVALKEVGTPWLIEIYSGMCASCKAYADIWHGVEAKVLQNTKVAVGRINMDESGGPPLAMKYNDKSCLENMHASLGLSLLREAKLDVLEHLSPDQRKKFRTLVIDMIMGTDLANHFQMISKYPHTFNLFLVNFKGRLL